MEAHVSTLTFRTVSQAALFEHELKGQLSDGHWENFEGPDQFVEEREQRQRDYGYGGLCVDDHGEDHNPYWGHWKVWSDADVAVGQDVGRDFDAVYDRYDLGDVDLLSVVGKRMVRYVRIAMRYGLGSVGKLQHALDLDGSFSGMPDYEGKYWDEVRTELADVDIDGLRRVVEDDSIYSWRDLIMDLAEMKTTIRIRK